MEKSNDESFDFGVLSDLHTQHLPVFSNAKVQPANSKESPFGAEAFAA